MNRRALLSAVAGVILIPAANAQKGTIANWDGFMTVTIEVRPHEDGDTRPIMNATVTLTLDKRLAIMTADERITRAPFSPLTAHMDATGVATFRVAFGAGGESHLDDPSRDIASVRIGADTVVRCEARGYAPAEAHVISTGHFIQFKHGDPHTIRLKVPMKPQ